MRRSRAPSYSNKLGFKSPLLGNLKENKGTEEVLRKNLKILEDDNCSDSFMNRCFSVVYGKRSAKKHKTWEGDGILEVGLKSVILKDENGKILGHTTNIKTNDLCEGSRICVGSKEVEIIEEKLTSGLKRPLECEEEKVIVKKPKNDSLFDPVRTKKKKNILFHSKFEELILPRPSDEHQWVYNSDCLPVSAVSVPAHLCRILRPHQREGVIFIYKCISGIRNVDYNGAILADEMGLGKTLQCISLIWTLLNSGPYGGKPLLKRVLIVVPSSLTLNWRNEFVRWIGSHKIKTFVIDKKNRPSDYTNDCQIPILIISYEMFMRGFDDIKKIDFDLIVCDEGHRLKNCSIKTTVALNSLKCKRRILLTGTPIQNDLQEFYALVNLVNCGILGSQLDFRKKYVDAIVASKEPNATDETIKLGHIKSEELNQLTSTFILRRTQSVIDKFLPPKNEYVVFCEPTSIQKTIYTEITNYWLEKYEEKIKNHEPSEHLTVIHSLKKLCNHPLLVQNTLGKSDLCDENISAKLKSIFKETMLSTNLIVDSGKMHIVEALLKILSETEEKVVLVSHFTQTLDLFEDLCMKVGYNYLRFDGSTSASSRSDIVNRFNSPNSKSFILLLSSKAGGVGLNLIGGSRLILYDSDWNPANDLQAMSRIWREGQKRQVHIYRLLTSGTIEEKIFQRQLSKAGLSESVVDPSATSNVKLSLEEIKDLFTFSAVDKCITHTSLKCDCKGDGSIPVEYAHESTTKREGELLPDNSSSVSCLRMNQLFQWEHHKKPVSPHLLKVMGLNDAAEEINYVFRNKTQ